MASVWIDVLLWPAAMGCLVLAATLRWTAAQLVFWADYAAHNLLCNSQKLENSGTAYFFGAVPYTCDSRTLARVYLTPHFSNPARYFFQLHCARAEKLWRAAIKPESVGGSGECEALARSGIAAFISCIDQLLGQRHADLTPELRQQLRSKYLNECVLAEALEGTLLFHKFIRSPEDGQSLTLGDISTVVFALLGASERTLSHRELLCVVGNIMTAECRVITGVPLERLSAAQQPFGLQSGSLVWSFEGEVIGTLDPTGVRPLYADPQNILLAQIEAQIMEAQAAEPLAMANLPPIVASGLLGGTSPAA